MEIILTIILIIWFIGSETSYTTYFNSQNPHHNNFNSGNNTFDPYGYRNFGNGFEEDGSVFDSYGHEHLVDEDGFCDDCCDYHDD